MGVNTHGCQLQSHEFIMDRILPVKNFIALSHTMHQVLKEESSYTSFVEFENK